ncbi:HTH-type transcriptional repressor KstR [Poriferisphaera corsica]|uniref:HTH-type transcriptional repressor KstR n=1 Tax=Poriferisphaera corsica TaxID=2528020 RepID=A0A517YUE1_9BACT|nr:TetR/AcrR family transcriptional regulator [Poriferisphaera corsica]QDU33863.1 HTH-type transcriptional repressor KstR [Poriferisphaera corsica]
MTQMADGIASMNDGFEVTSRLPLDYVNQNSGRVQQTKVPANLSREQILDATLSCLLESGYDGTTIRKIAKRLDCAVGSIYRYFKDKRELLDAVLQRRFEPVLDQLEGHHTVRPSVGMYVKIALEDLSLYQLMFWIAMDARRDRAEAVADTGRMGVPRVLDEIIEAWGGRFTQEDLVEGFWAGLHGHIMVSGSVDDVLAKMSFPSEKHVASSPMPPAPRLTPVIVQSSPPPPRMNRGSEKSGAPEPRFVDARERDEEDVTLL